MRTLILLSLVLYIVSATSKNEDEEFLSLFQKGIEEFFSTGVQTKSLLESAQRMPMKGLLRDHNHKESALTLFRPSCIACSVFVNALVAKRKLGASKKSISAELKTLCTLFKIEKQRVCDGFIELNLDTFLYIIDNGQKVGNRFCALALQDKNCEYLDAKFDWSVNVPEGQTVAKKEISGNNKFSVLHLSDYHYDPNYTPGKTKKCNEPLCCQSDQQEGKNEEDKCGYWIEYKDGDTPWHLLQETFKQANKHNFSYVYFTGDVISHRVWDTSIGNNSRDIRNVFREMKKTFDVPVFPVLGNHESNPLDVYPGQPVGPKNISQQWLFELVAKEWSVWLPNSTYETILKGGFYTVSPKPGFRIIALNSNVAYVYNWWLVYNDTDPYGQLQWLADTLYEAEKNEESVHIISHVPTGDDTCFKIWGREYSRIIERFANTITGVFNGHTHYDEFNVYYNKSDPTQAIGVAYNGASVTTYIDNNPSYKVFDVDADSLHLLNYEEWTFNVTQANRSPGKSLDWYKLYSFTDAYGAKSLAPEEAAKVVLKMTENHDLLLKYNEYKSRQADPSLEKKCSTSCQKIHLCNIVTTEYGEDIVCQNMKKLYDQNSKKV